MDKVFVYSKGERRDIKRAVFLSAAFVFMFIGKIISAGFIPMFLIYLLSLYEARDNLRRGFECTCNGVADTYSLVFAGSMACLLHGLLCFDERNLFLYSATTLLLCEVGGIMERHYDKHSAGMADRAVKKLLPIYFAAAFLVLIYSLWKREGFTVSFINCFRVLALLCPCNIAFVTALGAFIFEKSFDRAKFKIRDKTLFEKLGNTRELIVDGEGILTESFCSLFDLYSIDADKIKLLAAAAAIEKRARHGYSAAIVSAAESSNIDIPPCEDYFEISGRGVGAKVFGDTYFLGNKKLLRDRRIYLPELIERVEKNGHSLVYAAKNGEFCGVFFLCSKKKQNTDTALERIGAKGIRRILLATEKRKELEKGFDILLYQREKVLQEFKNNAKIRSAVFSRIPIATADVVCTVQESKISDAVIYSGNLLDFDNLLALGIRLRFLTKTNIAVAIIVSAFFAAGNAEVMAASIFFIALTAVFCLGYVFARPTLPDNTSLEDDSMFSLFSKVNYSMKINGMSCAHCVAKAKAALESLRGVSAEVSLEEKTARIKCPASTTAQMLQKAVTDAGYTVVSVERV